MTTTATMRLQREIAALAGQLQPPAAPMTAVELARLSGMEPDAWQHNVLTSTARQLILLASRQAGKSSTTAVLAAHQAVSEPGSLTLILSPSLRQSGELYLKVRHVLDSLGDLAPAALQENATTLRLVNGSRVVSLPSSERTIRGYSAPALLIEDESARVDDRTFYATSPMLAASQGRHILLSSAFGRRGHFHTIWQDGGAGWERHMVTAHDIPHRIPPAWLEEQRAVMGSWFWEQEFLCIFKDAVDSFFRSEDIDDLADDTIVPLFARSA